MADLLRNPQHLGKSAILLPSLTFNVIDLQMNIDLHGHKAIDIYVRPTEKVVRVQVSTRVSGGVSA